MILPGPEHLAVPCPSVGSTRQYVQAFNACKVCNDPNIGDKGGVIGLLTGGRVSRPDYTRQSIEMAILSLK